MKNKSGKENRNANEQQPQQITVKVDITVSEEFLNTVLDAEYSRQWQILVDTGARLR
ncbi:MAG TPA: hypothetical protein VGB77_22230 [Abditibacteriaceae bacterium]|jgi:hypothetical protein